MHDKATFMKELKVSIKDHQEQERKMEVFQLRKTMWTELRTAVRSIHELEPLSRERCTTEMEDLYLTAMRRRRLPSSNFWSLPIDSVKIAHHSISHDAPLGMRTNWGLQDKNHIGHKIALSKQSAYDWLSAKKWYAAIDEAYGSTLSHPIMKLPPSALIQDAITLVLPTVEWERLHWLPLRPNWAYQNQQLFEYFMPQTFKYLDTFLYVKEDWNNSKLLIQHAQSLKLGAPTASAPQHLELPKDFTYEAP